METNTYLQTLAEFSLVAMGFTSILAPIILKQSSKMSKSQPSKKPISRGIWGTSISFLVVILLSLLPMLILFVIKDLDMSIATKSVWKGLSFLFSICFTMGLIQMTVYSFGKINSEKELSFEEKKYQKVAARWTIPVLLIPLVFGIWNVFLGYESIYLILMTSFFTGILIWTGFILRYAQENKIRL